VTSTGDAAFYMFKSLAGIIIPKAVTKIEGGAFGACTKLEEVALLSSAVDIAHNVFDGCDELRIICCVPEIIRGMVLCNIKVMSYRDYIFSNYHDSIEGKNISVEEAKGLYYLIKCEKLKGADITLQDIMNTFPIRTRKDIESMMRCVGLNINIGNLSIRSKNQCSQILAL